MIIEKRTSEVSVAEDRRKHINTVQYQILLSLLNSLPDMLWLLEKQNNFPYANKALKTFLGNDGSELIKKTNQLSEGTSVILEMVKGDAKYLEITKYSIDNGYGGIIKDVTLTLQMKEKILMKLNEVENGNTTKLRMAQDELKNTINLLNERWSL